MKIATALYPIEWHRDLAAYQAKLAQWVQDAAENGTDLVVFPEYAGIEAVLLGEPDPTGTDRDWAKASAGAAAGMMSVWSDLAERFGLYILAGSGPAKSQTGYVNRSRVFGPGGISGHQDKRMLTPWEKANTPLGPGSHLSVFETSFGRLAIAICYDAEFPRLIEGANPDILLIPACTDTRAGAERLRVAARARALESQCVTVLSSTVGPVPFCAYLDENFGYAGVYAPPDNGFPETGVLAEQPFNQSGWVYAEFDFGRLAQLRKRADAPLRADALGLINSPIKPGTIHLKP
ncbi:MAG: nitrilase-related carbon-nitrogen hydrolase [Pseudomonadota bacterium]